MEKHRMHYETLLKVTQAISMSKDSENVVVATVEAIKTALEAKGAALFLVNKKTNELQLAAANGLSKEYLDKGPLSAAKSIAASLEEGPVAVLRCQRRSTHSVPKSCQRLRNRLHSVFTHFNPRSSYRSPAGLHRRALGIHYRRCKSCSSRCPDCRNGA